MRGSFLKHVSMKRGKENNIVEKSPEPNVLLILREQRMPREQYWRIAEKVRMDRQTLQSEKSNFTPTYHPEN